VRQVSTPFLKIQTASLYGRLGAMKQIALTRKHKIALTGDLGEADEKIVDDLIVGGFVERGGHSGLRLTAAGKKKSGELKLGLAGRGPTEDE
jgi:hypothetical protein